MPTGSSINLTDRLNKLEGIFFLQLRTLNGNVFLFPRLHVILPTGSRGTRPELDHFVVELGNAPGDIRVIDTRHSHVPFQWLLTWCLQFHAPMLQT